MFISGQVEIFSVCAVNTCCVLCIDRHMRYVSWGLCRVAYLKCNAVEQKFKKIIANE